MKNLILTISVISLICGCANLSTNKIEQPNTMATAENGTYFGQLKSLLSRFTLTVRPKATERNINLIDSEKGAAGMFFGESMDAVVAIWGKPSGIMIRGSSDIWDLNIGACDFGFIENKLVSISVHNVTIENAYFSNGISFNSSFEEVKTAFGEPMEESDFGLEFINESGFITDFHFIPDSSNQGKPKLITITIHHPDTGK